jgi:hypothetical protein
MNTSKISVAFATLGIGFSGLGMRALIDFWRKKLSVYALEIPSWVSSGLHGGRVRS